MARYDAVLFDNDGVLVEPPAKTTQVDATRRAFASLDVPKPDPAHVKKIAHEGTPAVLEEVAAAHDLDPATLWRARDREDQESQLSAFQAGKRGPYDDVSPVVSALDRPVGVVSNNHHRVIGFVLDHFDLAPHVDTFFGREPGVDNLGRKKPDPHYVEAALDVLDADSALLVGDRQSDVVAAHRAGIDSAFLRRPHVPNGVPDREPTYEIASLSVLPDLLA